MFCGAGGAAVGYARAGFEVVGVDIAPQPNYPFTFHTGDALLFLTRHWRDFDAVHASPPCQASTALTRGTNRGKYLHVNLIPAVQEVFDKIPTPSVIENVPGSKLRRDLVLCGEMFGLPIIRHRYFEVRNWTADQPAHIPHRGRVSGYRHGSFYEGPYIAVYGQGGGKRASEWQQAMGVDWTTDRQEIAEMVPPAYTELVGQQLAQHLIKEAAA